MNHVVANAEGVTADWLNAVVGDHPAFAGAAISDVTTEPIGSGMIARMVRAALAFDGATEAPSSVVVKFPSDDPGSFGLAAAMGLYELETRFYQDVAPMLDDFASPRCFAAAFDPDTSHFTLVLEDLSGSTRPGDVMVESELAECEAALNELARFQAPLWNNPQLEKLSWLGAERTHGVFDALPQGVGPFLDRFGASLEPKHVALFESVLPRAGEWVRSWTAPTVLQHGDFRSDNLLFGTTPATAPVSVIDFQTVRIGPPGVDAAYFLGSSLSTEKRRAVERELIATYHKTLVAAGVEDFDFDDAWSSYRAGALYGVMLFVGMASQVESTERGDLLIVDQIKRYADMAIDLESATAAGLV